jgi:hypothetical protein
VCLRELGQVQQLVPVGQTVEMTTGVAPELQQGAPSIMWGEGGSVQRSAPAVHAKAASSDRQLCSKQWMAASVLPLKGAAEAALPGEQPLLRRLVQADLPAFVFGLTAGGFHSMSIPLLRPLDCSWCIRRQRVVNL